MTTRYKPVLCTVDVVLLTLRDHALHVGLLRRDREPFVDELALPGGYIHAEEDRSAADAAARVLRTKLGLPRPYLEQLATFSGPARDPRGWSISIAYYALVAGEAMERARPGLCIVPISRLRKLPFDHRNIVDVAVARLRNKSQYSSLPVHFCGPRFTLPQLQAVYEAVLGEPINKVSFRRKMSEFDMLEPIPGEFDAGKANRPAQLYRLRRQYRQALSIVDRGLNTGA